MRLRYGTPIAALALATLLWCGPAHLKQPARAAEPSTITDQTLATPAATMSTHLQQQQLGGRSLGVVVPTWLPADMLPLLIEAQRQRPPGLSDAQFFQRFAPELSAHCNATILPSDLAGVWQTLVVAAPAARSPQARAQGTDADAGWCCSWRQPHSHARFSCPPATPETTHAP